VLGTAEDLRPQRVQARVEVRALLGLTEGPFLGSKTAEEPRKATWVGRIPSENLRALEAVISPCLPTGL
jgi:hypothetical protein